MSAPLAPAPTQNELVLAELQRRQGEWVEMPRLCAVSGSLNVHSRISNLRDAGHQIEWKWEGHRPRRSFYRLIQSAPDPAAT